MSSSVIAGLASGVGQGLFNKLNDADFIGSGLKGFTGGLSNGISSGLGNLIDWKMSGQNIFNEQQAVYQKNLLEQLEKNYNYSSSLSEQSYNQTLGLQNNQNALQLQYDKNKYAAQVQGMKDAGLNPAAMYGALPSSGGVTGGSSLATNSKEMVKASKFSFKQFQRELEYVRKFINYTGGKSALQAMKLLKQLKKG